MVIHALDHCTPRERLRVRAFLATPRAKKRHRDVTWLRDLMDAHGSLEYARQIAHGMAGAAEDQLRFAFGRAKPGRDRDFIERLPRWVIDRR
jgi:geranylgeranyl diphosphate synthase type II